MSALLLVAESIGLIVGSLTVGILFCWMMWCAFRTIRHPEWGPLMVIAPAILALTGRFPDSQFLKMSLLFAILIAGPFWQEGRAWRSRWRDRARFANNELGDVSNTTSLQSERAVAFAPAYHLYPAITGCICEARRPATGEVKTVAARILREGLPQTLPSFAAKRTALRVAKAALEGTSRI